MFGLAHFKASRLQERRIYIVFFNSVFGLALLKNEEYTLHLALLGSHTLHSLKMEHRSAAFFSNCTIGTYGTIRRIVYARPPGVNICSLQMEHRSAASFVTGAIGTNGTNEMKFANGLPMD